MFGPRLSVTKAARDEAEKPFWISYADLMTALMALFLIVMVVALVNVQQQSAKVASQQELIQAGRLAGVEAKRQKEHAARVRRFEEALARALPKGARLNFDTHRIDLGAKAKFANAESSLTPAEETQLRLVARQLIATRNNRGIGLLRRVDIEGFASKRGRFLGNLKLSLERSERMMCAMLTGTRGVPAGLTMSEQRLAGRLFAIGGRSSNDLKRNEAAEPPDRARAPVRQPHGETAGRLERRPRAGAVRERSGARRVPAGSVGKTTGFADRLARTGSEHVSDRRFGDSHAMRRAILAIRKDHGVNRGADVDVFTLAKSVARLTAGQPLTPGEIRDCAFGIATEIDDGDASSTIRL